MPRKGSDAVSTYRGGCVDCIYECKDTDERGRLRGIADAVAMVKTKNGQRAVCLRHASIHSRVTEYREEAGTE